MNKNGNNIILTEGAIKKIIKETLHRTLLENFGDDSAYKLSDDFVSIAEELERYAWKMKCVIKEHSVFTQAIRQCTEAYGLILDSVSDSNYYDLDNLINGQSCYFEYTFTIPNVDWDTLSDEEFGGLSNRIQDIALRIEQELKSEKFLYGDIAVRETDYSIGITYSFKL